MSIEDGGEFQSEEEQAAVQFDSEQVKGQESQEAVLPMQAHKSWKEKMMNSLADWNGGRAETVHLTSLITAGAGAFEMASYNDAFRHIMEQSHFLVGTPSSAEQFLIAGAITVGTAALLEIGNYVATKIAQNKTINEELKAQEA
jgi:hypothetical protein